MADKKTIGIISGLNLRAALEVKAQLLAQGGDDLCIIMSEESFNTERNSEFALSDRKIFVFNEAELLAEMGADLIVVPDFKSGSFIHEVQREIQTPIIDMKSALMAQTAQAENVPVMGILDSSNAATCMSGECDISKQFKMVFTTEEEDKALDEAREQIRSGEVDAPLATLEAVSQRLIQDGAQVIVPNCTQFALLQKELVAKGVPVMDVFPAFAAAVLAHPTTKLPKPFKLGLIGGLGPAATVDLYDKIVKATPAKNDQEHFKVVIEQNPQIDDRTACLLNGGADPTLAMYNCAKRLQKDGCDYAIIPCNTAHAFLPRLLRHLDIPFIDMQQTMLDAIKAKYGEQARVGLMATSGTLRTGIYSQKAEKMGMQMFVPDAEHQERVMSAIYGPKGAKAGFTTGECYEDLYSAAEYLVKEHGCNVLILGCTELPLIFHEQDDFDVAGQKVAIVDPTATLARKCVEVAEATIKERGVR